MKAGERGFSLVELSVAVAVLALGAGIALAAFAASARTLRVNEPRDAALQLGANLIVDARAVSAYDAAAPAALSAPAPASWPEQSATVTFAAGAGLVAVTVAQGGARVRLSAPLVQEAPPPGAGAVP